MAAELKVRLEKIARAEIGVIMDRLLETALQQQEWGVPPILADEPSRLRATAPTDRLHPDEMYAMPLDRGSNR
jgi:hypothetical protein